MSTIFIMNYKTPKYKTITNDISIKRIQVLNIPGREINQITPDSITPLVESIQKYGILSCVLVVKYNDIFRLISGRRLFLASKLVGYRKIPARIITIENNNLDPNDLNTFFTLLLLIKTYMQKPLSSIEYAKIYEFLISTGEITESELYKRFSITRSSLNSKLRLLSLPKKIQKLIITGVLHQSFGRELLRLGDPMKISCAAQQILKSKMTYRQALNFIKNIASNSTI